MRPGATIERTILLPSSSVGEGAYLEDCIVGHGYDVRAGERIRGVTLVRGATRKGASRRRTKTVGRSVYLCEHDTTLDYG